MPHRGPSSLKRKPPKLIAASVAYKEGARVGPQTWGLGKQRDDILVLTRLNALHRMLDAP
jgi:hypothetical protein